MIVYAKIFTNIHIQINHENHCKFEFRLTFLIKLMNETEIINLDFLYPFIISDIICMVYLKLHLAN